MTFEEFAREHGVSVERTTYTGFTDEKSDRFSRSVRFYSYRVTLLRAGQRFETDWRVGEGVIMQWASARRISRGRKEDPASRDFWGKRYQADAESLLCSLALDAQSADQEFEEWARDLGYDPDSRKAEGIWRACGDVGRRLRNWLGIELYGALLECEEA